MTFVSVLLKGLEHNDKFCLVILFTFFRLEEIILKMVAISKHHFVPDWTNMSCKAVVHPWTTSCLKASPMFYRDGLLGSAKFFSLIYLVSNIFLYFILYNCACSVGHRAALPYCLYLQSVFGTTNLEFC